MKKIEKDYLSHEHVIDQETERFVIHVDESSDSESDNSDNGSVSSEENMSGIEELD